jgi:hypothetical protein
VPRIICETLYKVLEVWAKPSQYIGTKRLTTGIFSLHMGIIVFQGRDPLGSTVHLTTDLAVLDVLCAGRYVEVNENNASP